MRTHLALRRICLTWGGPAALELAKARTLCKEFLSFFRIFILSYLVCGRLIFEYSRSLGMQSELLNRIEFVM